MKVLLFGLGHLGKKVVKQEEFNKFKITATYRSLEKIKNIQDINLLKFELGDKLSLEFFQNFNVIILNFPPRDGYLEFLKELHKHGSQETSWVFVSSTSVFGEGNINEDSEFHGTSKNAEQLKLMEAFIRNKRKQFLLLRPGGLVDDQRHPSKYLQNKDLLTDSEREINFIHTDDVARFISYAIKNNLNGEFNIVSSEPLKRRIVYQKYFPDIVCDHMGERRVISNKKLLSTGFKLDYPNIENYLNI